MELRRPEPGCWTYEDLAALSDTGRRYEIIGGDLYEMTGPTAAHADAVRNLMYLLQPYFRALRMTWFTAPLDVIFGAANPVQPDIAGFAHGGAWERSDRGIEGAPAFVVEVLSPSTRGKDVLTKRSLYQQAGVAEYWIVDPAARTVEVLALDEGLLREHARAEGDQPVRSRLFPELAFPAAAVFAEEG